MLAPEKVMFRADKKTDEVFAVFPHIPSGEEMILIYDRKDGYTPGQYQWVLATSRPATEAEYACLKRHIEGFYHNSLQVIQRRDRGSK